MCRLEVTRPVADLMTHLQHPIFLLQPRTLMITALTSLSNFTNCHCRRFHINIHINMDSSTVTAATSFGPFQLYVARDWQKNEMGSGMIFIPMSTP